MRVYTRRRMKTTVILGAGFSKNSGVPVQAEIPEYLINSNESSFDLYASRLLRSFMEDVFGFENGREIPNLDDVFTCIDISTNSGHHLGFKYSPQQLRSIRRYLVYMVYSIIEEKFQYSKSVEMLLEILIKKNCSTNFVVLNWDTVLEKYLKKISPGQDIDYCAEGRTFNAEETIISGNKINVIKIHGSCNWLYCDNCRSLFYDMHDTVPIIKRAGFMKEDFMLLKAFSMEYGYKRQHYPENCRVCGDCISAHIATFSYRKSFRANSFPSIWNKAETVLSDSDKWVFIGYSLPESDYEFKHLLKIAELKLDHLQKHRLKIDIVLLNSDSSTRKYEKFFGKKLNYVCNSGIDGYIGYLEH